MTVKDILLNIKKWKGFETLREELVKKQGKLTLKGVENAGAAYVSFAALSVSAPEKKMVYVAPNDYAARRAYGDFNFLSGGKSLYLEHSEYMFYDALAKSSETEYRRMEVIKKLAEGDYSVLVLL